MRVAIIGRSLSLLRAAELIHERGHEIPIVWTCQSEANYAAKESDFKDFANKIGAQFMDSNDLGAQFGVKLLADLKCDVAVSVNWRTLLPPQVLTMFEHGVINLHAGDLPRYRGNACPNWAILQGEEKIGMCAHVMSEELDSGDVLNRKHFMLSDDIYIADVYEWIDRVGPEMLADTVDNMGNGTLKRETQPTDPSLWLRAYPRRPEDSRIEWKASTADIMRMIRASSRPFDGAFCLLKGDEKVTIWRAEPVQHPGPFLAVPGQVCYALDGDPVIATSDGMLRLLEVETATRHDSGDAKKQILTSLRNRLT
jgi:methionyl-tRNA formyltransferase